jgi:hypothetical protein
VLAGKRLADKRKEEDGEEEEGEAVLACETPHPRRPVSVYAATPATITNQ